MANGAEASPCGLFPHDLVIFREHFLAIESDFVRTLPFVEVCDANNGTYSLEYMKILLAAGAEVDILTRYLAKHLDPDPEKEYRRLDKKGEVILKNFPNIGMCHVLPANKMRVKASQIVIAPWSDWDGNEDGELDCQPPRWWTAYNDVKHDRGNSFSSATLWNAMSAMAAWLVVLLYLERIITQDVVMFDTQFFRMNGMNSRRIMARPQEFLPDFRI
ncbi:hypothetical protein [Cerasicoccus maritimus]|uniref:hypothetical protein n=1 Tax=Cerasicoccus maritimus TaxID=490089 RepID=UPI002852DA7E|nr:hypothetical protein [Cerasicoccus maritimus]